MQVRCVQVSIGFAVYAWFFEADDEEEGADSALQAKDTKAE
jgi:hypothetical protein